MSEIMNARIMQSPIDADMRSDVLNGLLHMPKRLPSKYFYDAIGSALFERICEQPEYYLTRTELAIMRAHADAMAAAIGPGVLLMEYGTGSGVKTQILLSHLRTPAAYMPIEISQTALRVAVKSLSSIFPAIEIIPLCADFTELVMPPNTARTVHRTVIYFPGSTIGNFDIPQALVLLRQMRLEMGFNGGALIGVDLKKDPHEIEAAYNDAAGVTAEFTLNMLARFNRELGADFNLSNFYHYAFFNAEAGRIETYIVSTCNQRVTIDEQMVSFSKGEAMLVEYSYKYSLEQFSQLCARADLRVEQVWTDSANRFSVQFVVPVSAFN